MCNSRSADLKPIPAPLQAGRSAEKVDLFIAA